MHGGVNTGVSAAKRGDEAVAFIPCYLTSVARDQLPEKRALITNQLLPAVRADPVCHGSGVGYVAQHQRYCTVGRGRSPNPRDPARG